MDIRRLAITDEVAFLDFNRLLVAEREAGNVFVETQLVEDFKTFYEKTRREETTTANPDWSTSTNYYAFIDNEIAGRIGCRWELDKGDLATVGGHIGYVTSPKFRQQGVMRTLLRYALDRYEERGINRIFITALADNLPSCKTIESVGGVLQDIITLKDGKTLARYWVTR
ncbi:GNAT family N-acetyltransferase [Streptococcus entericus]|uniref:GNAT family N-acetyltransferase n=1 Tax=Streptococcus entericus TaxID=155680 RepID=UPI000366E262|nr:GNAT family N-acetyltransferase [Streptococcus entericus]